MSTKYKHIINQSRANSFIEAVLNVFSGMVIAWSISMLFAVFESEIQMYIWSGFSWQVGAASNVIVTVVLTVVSVCRGFLWRRYFNKRLTEKYKLR